MSYQQMILDIIDYRLGKIDKDGLRQRFRNWQVPPERAKWEVEMADKAGPVRQK